MDTTGWTIRTWHEKQISSTPDEALNRLLKLLENITEDDPAWITVATEDHIKAQWEQLHEQKEMFLPLYGVPFAVKDNIDVADFPTTAACPDFSYVPEEDSTVVKLLKKAGAIVVGKTNLDQFATGLVGTRSPYGKLASTFSSQHISGGSSSGSAVVTARGIVPFSLGTDTAGSGRVPAHLNNLIGVKPTRGIISTCGVVPACRTLDCVSIFTLCLSDAEMLLSIVAKYDENDPFSRRIPTDVPIKYTSPRFAVPKHPNFCNDLLNYKKFEDAIQIFKKLKIDIIPADFKLLHDLANLLYDGPWVAERYTVLKSLLENNPNAVNETVRIIVQQAENYTAADYFLYEYKRQELLRQIEIQFENIDALIVPTVPLNPTFAQVEEDPIGLNSRLGIYTNFVNLADMSALAIPAGFRLDNLPFGITLISRKFNDYALLRVAEQFLNHFEKRHLGATKLFAEHFDKLKESTLLLAVVGAHLSGMELNYQLLHLGAKLHAKTHTAPNYRLYALSGQSKPGLRRVAENGAKIELEIWEIPSERFAEFITLVPPPLGIGSIELENHNWVKGFICEEIAFQDAEDITHFGGWRPYVQSLKQLTNI